MHLGEHLTETLEFVQVFVFNAYFIQINSKLHSGLGMLLRNIALWLRNDVTGCRDGYTGACNFRNSF